MSPGANNVIMVASRSWCRIFLLTLTTLASCAAEPTDEQSVRDLVPTIVNVRFDAAIFEEWIPEEHRIRPFDEGYLQLFDPITHAPREWTVSEVPRQGESDLFVATHQAVLVHPDVPVTVAQRLRAGHLCAAVTVFPGHRFNRSRRPTAATSFCPELPEISSGEPIQTIDLVIDTPAPSVLTDKTETYFKWINQALPPTPGICGN